MYHVHQPLPQKQLVTQSPNWQPKIAVGLTLDEMINPVTGTTYAMFEPALDYVVAKIPRFPFDKFEHGERRLGTQMKATGEVMAIGRNIEESLLKACRSLEIGVYHNEMPELVRTSQTTPWLKRLSKLKTTVSSTFLKPSVVDILLKNCQS